VVETVVTTTTASEDDDLLRFGASRASSDDDHLQSDSLEAVSSDGLTRSVFMPLMIFYTYYLHTLCISVRFFMIIITTPLMWLDFLW
jgi:hypothetical protein